MASVGIAGTDRLVAPQQYARCHHLSPTSCSSRLFRPANFSLRSTFLAATRDSVTTANYRGHGPSPSFAGLSNWAPALTKCSRRPLQVRAAAAAPLSLIPPSNHWALWSVVLCIAAFGIWSETKTEWGYFLTGGLVNTYVALAASNAALIATEAPAYSIINQYLLPLTFPLFLLKADLRAVVASTGRLLVPFCLGSVATILGTFVAMKVVPLHTLGSDAWKLAAALMSRHIGGGANYMAISQSLGVSSSVAAAGLAADNLVSALYFTVFFILVSRLPKKSLSDAEEVPEGQMGGSRETEGGGPRTFLLQNAAALALSTVICTLGASLTRAFNIPGGITLCATVLTVLLATLCPSWVAPLAPSGEALAIIMIQIFFTAGGASTSIWSVLKTAPYLLLFSFVQIAVHLVVTLSVGRFLRLDQKLLLVASNANVGGPTTAAGLAIAKGWDSLMIPGILAGICGVAISTSISVYLGATVLQFL